MFIKTIKVLRNNWKKSVFFSCLSVYGIHYGNNKLIEQTKMRAYCEEALRFGDHYIRADQLCRHITVILNPMANRRKSKQNYEKYCAPLLHLAGIRVSVVVTEAEGQARDLMEIMDNTDAVLIAGGNGTVHEVVTGLLRRADSRAAVHRMPIGILPVGRRNTIALQLNRLTDKNVKTYEVLAQSTMSAIREVLKSVDVMRIEGTEGRPVYALDELNCGTIRETFAVIEKYWYLGNYLKPYLAFIFNSFKSLPGVEGVNISYSKPCTGCSKCYQRFERQTAGAEGLGSRDTTRWWHIFMSRKASDNHNTNESKVDLRSITNDECNQWSTLTDVNADNLLIQNTKDCKLNLIIHSQPLKYSQFISDGVKLFNGEPLAESDPQSGVQVIEAMDINIDLPIDKTSGGAVGATDVESDDGEGDKIVAEDKSATNSWFSIDTESYERQSVKITLLPKVLNMYTL